MELQLIKSLLIFAILILVIVTIYGSVEIDKISENVYRNSIMNAEMIQ